MTQGHLDISEKSLTSNFSRIKNVIIGILIVVVIALIIKVSLPADERTNGGLKEPDRVRPLPPGKASNVCMTEACIEATNRIFKHINTEVDPCEDFYEFSCGRFLKEAIIPDEENSIAISTPMDETIYDRAKIMLEEPIQPDDWDSVIKAKKYYNSCMNLKELEKRGLQPLQETLSRVVSGWPVLGTSYFNPGNFKWFEAVAKLRHLGLYSDIFLNTGIGLDALNKTQIAVYFDQPGFGMSRNYLVKGINDTDVQSYLKFMVDTAVLLGANVNAAETKMGDVLNFEIDLAKAATPEEERRDANQLYNPYILEELQSLPGHPPSWTDYVNSLLTASKVSPGQKVIVEDPAYLKKMAQIIAKTESQVVANYIGWRISQQVMSLLNKDARSVLLDYKMAISGISAEQPRWKFCAEVVGFNSRQTDTLLVSTASMYARKYFSKEAKKEVNAMVGYIEEIFEQMLRTLNWMDPKTKSGAFEKLEKLKWTLGYPDEVLNKNLVDGVLKNVNISESAFYENYQNIAKWESFTYEESKLIEGNTEENTWLHHLAVALVNAFYGPGLNAVFFPAGYLQGVVFNPDAPKYLNYGSLGATIGHELTHGFDDQGSQYDKDGNLFNWWKPEARRVFKNKTDCVVQQYNKFKEPTTGLNLNGINVQGESIADIAGLKEAFNAYSKWVDKHGEEPDLPGLNFSQKQLFFISFGQSWCDKWRTELTKNIILTNEHPPSRFRVIGSVSNSPDFAEAFNCKIGTPMNPEKKCTVW